jgi:WD40 repeat protein
LDKIQRDFPNYPYHDLLKAIQVSIDELKPDDQARYLDFAVFPEDTPIPEAVLQTFWEPQGLDKYDAQDLLYFLVDRSLVRQDEDGNLSLHDLQFDYVKKQSVDLIALHDRLLNAYRTKCLNGWAEGPNDGYFFQHLAYHLDKAGCEDELRSLLLDFDWIKAKLESTDVPSLIADYDFLSDDSDTSLVRDSIRLSAHVLADKAQLASQLLGRLMDQPSTQIQAMLDQMGQNRDEFWIRPLTPCLTPPGGPLIRTLSGHSSWVNAVAVTPDGRKAISASGDSTLKVWDLEKGQELRTLRGHSSWVRAVAVTPDGLKVVSASSGNTLKVWDLEKGEVIATFTGDGSMFCCAIASDGVTVIAGESSSRIHFLRLEGA